VPSPRRQELDKDRLSGGLFLKVIHGELNGISDSQKAEEHSDDRLHDESFSLRFEYLYSSIAIDVMIKVLVDR